MGSSRQDNWDIVPLGTLAEFKNGVNYSKENFGKGMKVINVGDFKDYTFAKLDDLDEINPEGIVREKDLLKDNDILFVRSNGNRELIGRSVIVAGLKEKISHSAFTIRGRFVSEKVVPRFYAYLLRSPQIRQKLSAYGGGTNISNLNQQILNSLPVPLPPIETQRKIASILSAYDDLVENNTRRIKILEDMARKIYREWFVNFRFPGHDAVKMVDSPLGKIPEGWVVKKVGEVLEKIPRKKIIQKQDYLESGEIPVVDQGKDFIGGYTLDEEALVDESLPLIVFGDHTRALKYIDFPFACGADGTQLLKTNTPRMPISLFYNTLQEIDLSNFAYARHFKFLKEEQLVVPGQPMAEMFDKFVHKIRNHIRCLKKKNQNLRQTRDLLLPKLISEEIRV